ncbi:hypothetical protein F5Y19DRAFT_469176 [Xylariaceae sp. FL1651]|nr:hypothetical protein F5Y19DRAFT_469176 [Xylariaceae sp. FL1651]
MGSPWSPIRWSVTTDDNEELEEMRRKRNGLTLSRSPVSVASGQWSVAHDPRKFLPSRAHPEHRAYRKQLEKEHPFGFTQMAVLGMLGLTLAWDIEKQVQKHEERKDKEEAEQKKREDRERRRREKAIRNGTWDPRREHMGSGTSQPSIERGSSSRGGAPRGYTPDPRRRQSVDYRANPRYEDRYPDARPRYEPRYDPRYDDLNDLDRTERGRGRRDSW